MIEFYYFIPLILPSEQMKRQKLRSIGYGRLSSESTLEQLESERSALVLAGCEPTLIFLEAISPSASDWPEFERAKAALKRGDRLVVTDLRRVARDVKHLALLLAELQSRGVIFFEQSWGIDTALDEGKQFVKHLAPLMSLESSLRLERQREGIVRAQADGKFKGREPTARKKSDDVLRLRKDGLTIAKIAVALSMGEASVFRIIKAARISEANTGDS